MKHACEHCGQKYAIPDARVAGRHLRVRCQKCSGVMCVDGSKVDLNSTIPLEAKRTPSMLGVAEWHVGIAGRAAGPYTQDQIYALVDGGEVRERTLMWRRGMPGWERVVESAQLHWVQYAVREREFRVGRDGFRTPTAVFEAVPPALVCDGRAYFPDPTLHTGFSVLSDEARAYLEAVARREVEAQRTPLQRYVLPAAAFLALSLVGAAGAWAATLL